MKEASGELSMTAITVTAIAAVAVIVTTFVMPSIKSTIENKTACAQAYACNDNGDGTATCTWDKPGADNPVDVVCKLD